MLIRITNDRGAVSFRENVIEQIIRNALAPFEGKVWTVSVSGTGKEIRMTDRGVYVKIYVAIRFGVSIRNSLDSIISAIANDVTDKLGLPIDNIVVNVTAVVSRNAAKRDITLDYHGNNTNAGDGNGNKK